MDSNSLLIEYRENRGKIKSMILDLEKHIQDIQELIPKNKNDFRSNKHYLENTLRTITEFYKLIFDMRKEIGKLVKDEITIVERLTDKDKDTDDDIFKRMSIIDKFLIETGVTLKDLNKLKRNKNTETSEENKDEWKKREEGIKKYTGNVW